jgi:hypothetical protein
MCTCVLFIDEQVEESTGPRPHTPRPCPLQVLEKYEVQIPDDQLTLLDSLDLEWSRFQSSLDDAGGKLERYKDNFREKVRVAGRGLGKEQGWGVCHYRRSLSRQPQGEGARRSAGGEADEAGA